MKWKKSSHFHSKRLFRSTFRKKSSIVSGNLEKKSPTFLTLCTKSALKKFTISRHKAPGRFTRLRSDCRVGLSPKVTRTYYEPRLAFRGRYGGHQRIASSKVPFSLRSQRFINEVARYHKNRIIRFVFCSFLKIEKKNCEIDCDMNLVIEVHQQRRQYWLFLRTKRESCKP